MATTSPIATSTFSAVANTTSVFTAMKHLRKYMSSNALLSSKKSELFKSHLNDPPNYKSNSSNRSNNNNNNSINNKKSVNNNNDDSNFTTENKTKKNNINNDMELFYNDLSNKNSDITKKFINIKECSFNTKINEVNHVREGADTLHECMSESGKTNYSCNNGKSSFLKLDINRDQNVQSEIIFTDATSNATNDTIEAQKEAVEISMKLSSTLSSQQSVLGIESALRSFAQKSMHPKLSAMDGGLKLFFFSTDTSYYYHISHIWRSLN